MTMQLTPQQQEGLDKVAAWYPTSGQAAFGDPFRWFGYAGTGKTFTAARIPEALGLSRVVYGTYTGKAASVLRKSLLRYGVIAPVSTIHSAIYKPTTSKAARDALDSAQEELAELNETYDKAMTLTDQWRTQYIIEQGWADPMELAGAISEVSESIPRLEADARRLRFEFNPESDWAHADLIILDEVSMVNAKLAADIESFGVPVLVLGDPAQLPPVEGGGYYTEATPDHLLTDIQRAAMDSPVTMLATRVRSSQGRASGLTAGDLRPPSLREAEQADIVLCWTNKRRWAMIRALRKLRFGIGPGDPRETRPIPGDSIMVLTNNKDAAVFNGELFEVLGSAPDSLGHILAVRSDTGQERELLVYREGFLGVDEQRNAKSSGAGSRSDRVLATFGQAVTVHKAQGSEWPHVYIVNEVPAMIEATGRRQGQTEALAQARAWLYTAVTRASERVTITRPKGI